MIEKPSDEMEISSTSLDLLSQAASLLNRNQQLPVSDYGVSSGSPPKDLPTKGQKVRRKKSVRREAFSGTSAIKIRAKKAQLSTGSDWDMNIDGYDPTKDHVVSSSVDQPAPPPPYPSSPSPPRNPVLPPYPSSYRGDPLAFPQSAVKGPSKNSNNNNTPLDMSKKSLQCDSLSKQHRPSVITCVSALQQQQCRHEDEKQDWLSSGVKDAEKDDLQQGHRREVLSGMCDPVIDEHFRRSLGKDYSEIFSSNTTPSVSVTVDDHFAKALGDTWLRLQQTKPVTEATKAKSTARQPVVQHAPGLVTL